MNYSKGELVELAARMRKATNTIYPLLTTVGVHTFIEFNGLMSKFTDICEKAAQEEIQFPYMSEHSGMALPVAVHDLQYLAEKLRCIFGPIIDANPEARRIFAQELLGIEI